MDAQIGFADALRRFFLTRVASYLNLVAGSVTRLDARGIDNIRFEATGAAFLVVVFHPGAAASLVSPSRWSKDAGGEYAGRRVSEGHPYEDSHAADSRSLPTG